MRPPQRGQPGQKIYATLVLKAEFEIEFERSAASWGDRARLDAHKKTYAEKNDG